MLNCVVALFPEILVDAAFNNFCFTDGLYLPFALFIVFLRTLIAILKNENKEQ